MLEADLEAVALAVALGVEADLSFKAVLVVRALDGCLCGDFLTVNVGELHFCIEAVAFRGVLSEVNGNLCLCLAFVAFAGHFTLKEHDVRAFYVERKAELELEIVNLVKDIRKA